MLVRLTILRPHTRSLQAQGLFAPAYALRREGRCPEGFESWLDHTLNWLDRYLYAPHVYEERAIFWLRDDDLEDSANLPDPHILAEEIADDLRAALEQIEEVLGDLQERASGR